MLNVQYVTTTIEFMHVAAVTKTARIDLTPITLNNTPIGPTDPLNAVG